MEPRQDPKRMEALLARRERQGLTWAELSRRSGLPAWKLRWWQRRLSSAKGTPSKVSASFVSVEVVPPARVNVPAMEVVTPSGFCLRVPADFDADHLRRLVGALEPGC